MFGRDLIVVGASAGGVEATTALVAGLPADLSAAVCVVVHMRPYAESRLVDILARACALPVVAARHGERLRPGVVHVAVPDLHLLVDRPGDGGMLRLVRGPRENRARPAIDPLFRSAALAFGPRVIGVILSGALDDGTAGLWAVKDRGGIAVVQDPADALVTGMPRSAIDEVGADHTAPAAELGPLLGRLARAPAPVPAPDETAAPMAREVALSMVDDAVHQHTARDGSPSRYPCPDCGGVLWEVGAGGPLRFRCETGHAYTAGTLTEAQGESVEAALWAALRAIEDRAALARRRADEASRRGMRWLIDRFTAQEEAAQQHGAVLRALLRLDGRIVVQQRADSPPPAERPPPDRDA